MTQTQQSIPEFENDNLLAKIFTSRKWQKKLSNQNMNYQWIPCDQSQIQSLLNQVQVNIPNAYVDSCESDFFTFSMKMKIPESKMSVIGYIPQADPVTVKPTEIIVVQYRNAVYMICYKADGNQNMYVQNKMLDRFVQAIESVSAPSNIDPNWNNRDFGFLHINTHDGNTPKTAVEFAYQKIMNLPYNSCCFLDRTTLSHQNVDRSKPLQQINRLIFRQQYDPKITQQYMNQHWYVYYGNNKPQVLFTQSYGGGDFTFSYQVMIPMNKIFWMWQQDFLPLFKLKNPLNLQFIFNSEMVSRMFNVIRYPTHDMSGSNCLFDNNAGTAATHAQVGYLIDYNTIVYYNIGCYLLVCSDTVMEKKLIEELNDMQGIVLPQTQTWIESYKTNTNEERQYQTNVGFNCLTNLEIGLYARTNQAYYRGYSTLKDIFSEYNAKLDNSNTALFATLNPKKGDFRWYDKQLSFYMPQITFNAKQTFIGQKFMNSIPLFLSINNRGQDSDDQNPFNENLFDYFNKLNIRYEQFTDKYVKDVESDEMNYSGVAIQKQNNNYITVLLANYNVPDLSSGLQRYTSSILNTHGTVTVNESTPVVTVDDKTDEYFVELLYKYKQILQIDQAGNLNQMLQEYML